MKPLLFLLLISIQAHATNYYVSNAGNDSNPGTITAPFRTLAKITGLFLLPKDTVWLKRGDMWREFLILQESGTAADRIVIGAYGTGALPIINGANLKTGWIPAYTTVNANIWGTSSTNVVSNRTMLIIDNVIYREVQRLQDLTDSTYFLKDATFDSVFVYKRNDPDLNVVEMSKRADGILMLEGSAVKYVTIQDIEVRYVGGTGIAMLGNGSDCIVKRCHLYANRLNGVSSQSGHANDLIDSCTASFNGNGIYAWIADGQTVRNCHTWESIHYSNLHFTDGGGIQNYQGKDWLVENCTSDRDNDAIHIDAGGVSTNAIIRYCKVSRSKTGNPATPGMGVGSVGAGAKVQFYYNELINNAEAGFTSWTVSQGTVEFFNNTIYSNTTTGTVWGIYARYGQSFYFKNNLIVKAIQNGSPLYQQDIPGTAVLDYNGYWQSPPASPLWRSVNLNYYTLAAWTAGYGQDSHSIYAYPVFVDDNADYRLQASSPMIDKGTNVGLTRDINGLPIVGLPDIGCHEFQSTIKPIIKKVIVVYSNDSTVVVE